MKKLSYYLTLMIFCIILSGIKAREKQSNQTKRERMGILKNQIPFNFNNSISSKSIALLCNPYFVIYSYI